ncbi:unnamed protein product [Rotaria sp. Silwood2]|nr:unnamed protein product [Rotaria sp. Silwood2]CAF4412907.1 unnamed protein product [Rotaria sp. Silwood2]
MNGGASSTVPNSLSNNHPSSSNTLNRKSEDSNCVPKRDHRADANNIVQNFLLIWLDAKIDESSDDYLNSIKQLREIVNTIEIFRDTDECIDYISELQNEKSFLIISGTLCQTIVPLIHNMPQLYSIYIFCQKQDKYEEWIKDWTKVKGIFIEITPICDSVRESARQFDEDSIVISAIPPSFSRIEPSFMYTQIFKEIILEINFDENKAINDLVEYAREKYAGNDRHLKIIDEFAHDYRYLLNGNNKPLWWYTRECFIYQMLNKALRTLQVETLLKMGIFIRDLHQNIQKLHSEQSNEIHSETTAITVYRGQTMVKEDFENKIKQGGLISFNSFLSTSDDRKVAIRFISKGLPEKDTIRVLFKMTINRSISSAPFARIYAFSYFKTEKEILFSMNTVFHVEKIQEIDHTGMIFWQVKLTLISENDDKQFNALSKRMRDEITGTGWSRMAPGAEKCLFFCYGEQEEDEESEGRRDKGNRREERRRQHQYHGYMIRSARERSTCRYR